MTNIIIQNAKLPSGEVRSVAISDQKIVPLKSVSESESLIINGREKLLLPAFVNVHLHVEKSFWRRSLDQLPEDIRRLHRFESSQHVKQNYTVENVRSRIDEAIRLAILHGSCALRLFVDVDKSAGLRALQAALEIRQKYSKWMTIEVAAFPQDGVFNGRGTEDLMHEAMKLGADMVGGIPWIERSEAAQKEHIDLCFRLADSYGCDLNFVVDDTEDPTSRTLELIAIETIRRGWQGRVSGTQCNALAFYENAHAARVIRLVKEAEIAVVQNAHVSLVTHQSSGHPIARGCTRIRELIEAGVAVATAQDDLDDWYYPLGRNDLLEVAQYMAHVGQFAWPDECHRVLDMVTKTPAQLMKLKDYGLEIGCSANLLLLDAGDWHSALQFQATKLAVILNGRIAARSRLDQELFLDC